MYLSHLVQSLEQRQPFALQLFKEYRGQEWKSLVQYHHDIIRPKSVVLFKSDKKKLVLTGWNLMQYHNPQDVGRKIVHHDANEYPYPL